MNNDPSGIRKRRPRIAFWGVILVLVAGLWLFLRQLPGDPERPMIEVARPYLTLRSGRLYHGPEKRTFTGFLVERYPGGLLKSRSVVSNGVLWGLSEGWHTNGVLQVQERFVQGVSDGLRTKWHENGQKASEVPIVKGKLHGTFQRWDEQGRLMESLELKNGEPDGVSMAWHPSGALKTRMVMANGKVVEKMNWKDGEAPVNAVKAAKP